MSGMGSRNITSTTRINGDLEGWLRKGSELKEIPEMKGFVSPRLQIRFEPGPGPDNLTIIGRDGRPLVSALEMFKQREAERSAPTKPNGGARPSDRCAETAEQAPRPPSRAPRPPNSAPSDWPRSYAIWGLSRIESISGVHRLDVWSRILLLRYWNATRL